MKVIKASGNILIAGMEFSVTASGNLECCFSVADCPLGGPPQRGGKCRFDHSGASHLWSDRASTRARDAAGGVWRVCAVRRSNGRLSAGALWLAVRGRMFVVRVASFLTTVMQVQRLQGTQSLQGT